MKLPQSLGDAVPFTVEMISDVLNHMLNGVAYCRMEFENEKPVDFVYLYTNPAFQKQTGLPEVAGKRVSEVIPGIQESDPQLFETYGRVASGGKPETFETYVESLKLWFSVQVFCPRAGHFVAVFDVISERKQREISLQQAQERLALAERAAKSGIWYWDIPSGTLVWSDAFFQLFGLDPSTAVASFDTWRRCLHPDDLGKAEETISAAIRNRDPLYNEYRIILQDGRTRWIAAYGDTTYGSDGKPIRMTGFCIDDSVRKELEQAIARGKEQLQLLNAATESRREEDRRQIARELHDDLGHRLTTLKMDIDRLEGNVAPRDPEMAARLAALGEEVITVVDAVRRISEDLRPGMLDALGLVAALEDLVSRFSKRTGIRCEFTSSHEEFKVADAIAIGVYRIAQEALNNALKYANATEIRVTLRCADDEMVLAVQDNGSGLPQPAADERQGFGLIGMRERISRLNGRLTISSEPGAGVCIEAVVPTSAGAP